MRKYYSPILLFLVVICFAAACGKGKEQPSGKTAMATAYSATIVNTMAGKTITTQMYIRPDRIRTDMKAGGTTNITIYRKDLNKMWTLMPDQKTYMEMEGIPGESIQAAGEKMAGEVSRKELGRETIGGHPAIKYEITASSDNKVQQVYQWWATDINFPIKTAAVDGSWSTEYKQIDLRPPADSVFEIPSGYKKMTMPAMPKGMGLPAPGMGKK